MQKPKQYDWNDSNLALFGSDTEKQVKKESAESELAWIGAGEKIGLQIWRINKFKVEHWPKEDYGDFFTGDSYIILNTYMKPGEDDLEYDLHFWIGKQSTQDEYGTAAYKTVELDTFLDDKPNQHREVGGHESGLFKEYFPVMTVMKGGVDTGFKRVLPVAYDPRFFIVKKQANKKITTTQISLKRSNYTEDDVFILDTGYKVYQINGENCSHDEKYSAAGEVNKIISSRGKCRKTIIDGSPFNESEISGLFVDKEKKEKVAAIWTGNKLFKVNTDSREVEAVAEGEDINRDLLDKDDAFLLDTENQLFVWIGTGASVEERKNAMSYACNYLSKTDYSWKAVSVIAGDKETLAFKAVL